MAENVPRSRLLTLMRHGRALPASGSDDHGRALDERGRADVIAVAGRRAVRAEPPDLLLCSDARRTVETAELVRETLGLDAARLACDDRLYLAPLDTLLAVIDEQDGHGHRHLMLIGHNPGLERLARRLDPRSPRGLSTATLCRYARREGSLAGERTTASDETARLLLTDRP